MAKLEAYNRKRDPGKTPEPFGGSARVFSHSDRELIELMARSVGRVVLEHRIQSERDRLQAEFRVPLPRLSMGMSGDYAVAIEEGATQIRIGTALFGSRAGTE